MSLGLELILSTAMVAAPAGCSWAHPGANPYRGEPARALADFDMPSATRHRLREMMAAHRYTDVATITRDDITGAHGYTDLREMHSGRGIVCHGAVDRTAWSATRRERGLVYCADDVCVIVPTICNNVSLVSRKPDDVAALDDSPIDIEPAAGPRPVPTETPLAASADDTPLRDFLPAPTDVGVIAVVADAPAGGGDGSPGNGFPAAGSPIGGGGGIACCVIGPVFPGGPGSPGGPGTPGTPGAPVGPLPPPISAIPEAPTWALLLGGLALIGVLRRR
jgi:MYXO-CTERM domain-containing protein